MIRLFHSQNRAAMRRRATITVVPLAAAERIAPGTYTLVLCRTSDTDIRIAAPLLLDAASGGTVRIDDVPFLPGDQIEGYIQTGAGDAAARIAAFAFTGTQTISYTSVFEPAVFPTKLSFLYVGGSSVVEIGANVTQWMTNSLSAAWVSFRDPSSDAALEDSAWYTLRRFSVTVPVNPFTTARAARVTLQCRNSYGKEAPVVIQITQNRAGLVPPVNSTETPSV